MDKKIKGIIKILLILALLVISFNSKVFAITILPGNSSYTTSGGTTWYYDRDNSKTISDLDFAIFAKEGAGRFQGAPIGDLAGKFVYIHNSTDGLNNGTYTINQPYAFCAGHGNTNASSMTNGSTGGYLYKICTILDIYPNDITSKGNGRVGANAASSDVVDFGKKFNPQISNLDCIKALSALARYGYDYAGETSTEQTDVIKLLNYYHNDLVTNNLLDNSINLTSGYAKVSSKGLLDQKTKDASTTYGNYANKVKNHKVENKTSINSTADRKEGTYSGTKYDYWGPFQITYSSDITSIAITTSNAGSYKGIASSVGGQPKVASTTNIKSNTNFYVVTTTTTSTSNATIKIKTNTNSDFYKLRMMFFKHSLKSIDGQNVVVWRAEKTSLKDELSITVSPSPKPGELTITKYNANKTKKLTGATFKIYNSKNELIHFAENAGNYVYYGKSTVITNTDIVIPSSGTVTVKNLPAGSYKLKEVKAPTGYVARTVDTNITITSGATKKIDVLNDELGKITITKLDSSNKSPLSGAVFVLTSTDLNGPIQVKEDSAGNYTYTGIGMPPTYLKTNSKGIITVKNLPKASYIIQETTPPTGYIKATADKKINVTYNSNSSYTFYNTKKPGSLEIFKYDKDVGKGKPLAGGEFIIQIKGTQQFIDATKESAGVYKYSGKKNLSDVVNSPFVTNSKGKITINDIPAGLECIITEKTPPPGYEKYEGTPSRTIEAGKKATVNVEETLKPGTLEIFKYDKDVGKGKPLEGGKFTLTTAKGKIVAKKESAGVYTYTSLNQSSGTIMETNSQGKITVNNLPANIEYTIKEEAAPAGYEKISKNLYKTVEPGKKATVNVEETLKPGTLEIFKYDKDVGKGKPLEGGKFTLTTAKGKIVAKKESAGVYTYTSLNQSSGTIMETNSQGKITVNNLPANIEYTIKEEAAPAGYEKISKNLYKTVEPGKKATVDVEETLKPGSIEIFKYDKKVGKGKPLAGGKFTLTTTKGKIVAKKESAGIYTYTSLNQSSGTVMETNSQGKITIKKLPANIEYTIKEEAAPVGYEKISKDLYKTVEPDKKSLVEVPEPEETIDLKVIKVSTDNPNKKVKGIGFKILCTGDSSSSVPKGWIKANSKGEWDGKYYSYKNADIFYTNENGYVSIKELSRRCKFEVYEVALGENKEFDELPKTTVVCYDSTKNTSTNTVTAKKAEEVPSNAAKNGETHSVSVYNDENRGSLKIKKIDTSGKGRVKDIGFKVFNETTKEWVIFNSNNGEYLGKSSIYDAGTTVKTDSTGYTMELKYIPKGQYSVYEVDLGSYSDIYNLKEDLRVTSTNPYDNGYTTIKVKKCGTYTIDKNHKQYTVEAKNTPVEGSLKIQKIDTSGKGRVKGVGFQIYDEENETWLLFNLTSGEFRGKTEVHDGASTIKTDNTGYTVELKGIPKGTYRVYETNLGSYSNIYKLTENLTVTSANPADNGYKTIKVKDCGSYTIDENHVDAQAVVARNTPTEIPGSIQIKKIDTGDEEKIVDGIGFKICNATTKEWITLNEATGKYEGTTPLFANATEIYTDLTGYTVKVKDVPPGTYVVYETNLGTHTEYSLGTTQVYDNKVLTAKTAKYIGSYPIKADEETNAEVLAKNTTTPVPGSLVIKKVDEGTKNIVSGIGFKVFDNSNNKWLQINQTTGEITGTTEDFELATELTTDATGYTVKIKDVPAGGYAVYETNLGTHTEYKLGQETVFDDNNYVEKDVKLIDTYVVADDGKEVTATAVNEQLGKIRVRKIDTSDEEKLVDGIGFKVIDTSSNEWLIIDEETGKVTGKTISYDEATTIYTREDGYSAVISEVPLENGGNYQFYETDVSSHPEYQLKDIINVPDKYKTKSVTAKKITPGVVANNKGEVVTVTAENSPVNKIKLSGFVWKNGINYGKTASKDNVYNPNIANDKKVSGLKVSLLDESNRIINETLTDEDGKYEFTEVNVDDLEKYQIQIDYDGIEYQVIDDVNKNGTNTNKFVENDREAFNSEYSTINNEGVLSGKKLEYIKNQHSSYLKNSIMIKAKLSGKVIATSDGVTGTTMSGEKISNISQIKNNHITEITNLNLGLYRRENPDLEIHEYIYQLISTDKENTDIDNQNTWQLNKRDINADYIRRNDYSLAIYDDVNNKILTKTGNEAKKMYAIYKIALVNGSSGINNKINSIVSYFDENYSFIKAEVADSRYKNAKTISNDKIIVEEGKVTFKDLDIDVKSKKTKYVYLKFEIPIEGLADKIETEGDLSIAKNYTEINSYTSYIGDNKLYAGIDKDSAPGNINVELFNSTCEDDESCSPEIWIIPANIESNTASASATDFIDKLMSAKFSD